MSAGSMPAREIVPASPQMERPREMAASTSLGWYFGFFFVSGFCSILYELIWLRLAMAQFGVTTAMVSIVLSTFMAGLGVGSWASGHLVRKYADRLTVSPLQLYGVAELMIACSAVVVPLELLLGRVVLERVGASLSLSSTGYYVAAGVWLACTLVPWCACMGATIPLGMFAIRSDKSLESKRSFSFLYLSNVLGAVAGTLLPLALIELFGFNRTLQIGMVFNLAICATALWLAGRRVAQKSDTPDNAAPAANNGAPQAAAMPSSSPATASPSSSTPISLPLPSVREMLANRNLWLLFATGLTSMGMEVVWTRLYTIYVGTLVYSFAFILGAYLAAMFLGSTAYRWWSRRRGSEGSLVWMLVWLAALLPLLTADKRLAISSWWRVPVGVAAFSGLLGFVTPSLVDRFSEGDPNRAGAGYAVNVAGCILGPLVAGFGLLPYIDERYALVLLALPWLIVGLWFAFRQPAAQNGAVKRFTAPVAVAVALILAASLGLILRTQSYVQLIPGAAVRRDSTATVVATGQGMSKQLYVNGVSMTVLTPITKVMASLPLALLDHTPQKALVICFGMGTTHRSMISWGIDSTAVDLVPSVPALFGYFHADAAQVLSSPHSHVVADDGRRFLERTNEQYDVIVIDPPPPIGAAGSSLLYSREFYSAARKRLRPDGILAQWFPGGDRTTTASVARALKESFPYVRVFVSMESWGVHYLASNQPIPMRSAAELARRLPPSAAADLVEWGPAHTAEEQFAKVLKNEVPLDVPISLDRNAPAMEDDRPVNEYGLLRHTSWWPH